MKKKMIVSTAAALTLMAAPLFNSAEASSGQHYQTQTKVYTYQFSGNHEDLNKWFQDIMSKYNVQWKYKMKSQQPIQEEQPQEEPAPQQQSPEQTTTVQQPEAEGTVPAAAPTTQHVEENTSEAVSGVLSQYEKQVVELTNQERAKHDLPALKIDTELSKVAREKSNDMQAKNYFSHTSPTYGSPFDMMNSYGIDYRAAGENIAMGQHSPEEVVNAWMNSEGHRKNILSSSFTHIGVGHNGNGNYWTQMFIGK